MHLVFLDGRTDCDWENPTVESERRLGRALQLATQKTSEDEDDSLSSTSETSSPDEEDKESKKWKKWDKQDKATETFNVPPRDRLVYSTKISPPACIVNNGRRGGFGLMSYLFGGNNGTLDRVVYLNEVVDILQVERPTKKPWIHDFLFHRIWWRDDMKEREEELEYIIREMN